MESRSFQKVPPPLSDTSPSKIHPAQTDANNFAAQWGKGQLVFAICQWRRTVCQNMNLCEGGLPTLPDSVGIPNARRIHFPGCHLYPIHIHPPHSPHPILPHPWPKCQSVPVHLWCASLLSGISCSPPSFTISLCLIPLSTFCFYISQFLWDSFEMETLSLKRLFVLFCWFLSPSRSPWKSYRFLAPSIILRNSKCFILYHLDDNFWIDWLIFITPWFSWHFVFYKNFFNMVDVHQIRHLSSRFLVFCSFPQFFFWRCCLHLFFTPLSFLPKYKSTFFTLFSVSHGACSSGGVAAELALSNGRATSMGSSYGLLSPPNPDSGRHKSENHRQFRSGNFRQKHLSWIKC